MASTININPVLTTTAAGTFNAQSAGYIQGTAMHDPAARSFLSGGILAPTETLPMWGGVGVSETATPVGTASNLPQGNLGGYVTRATTLVQTVANGLTAFSVFDQVHAMINTPQSPVPLSNSNMQVNFYRLGSNARICVAIDPALVNLEGLIVSSQVSWDFALQRLIPYVAAYAANVITASTWAATGGGQVTFTTTSAHGVTVGSDFTITGEVPTGYNGTYTAIAGTAGSTLVAANITNPGASTTQGTLVAGGGALACRVLDLAIGNCMTVTYNPLTGFATWNYNGSGAVILI